MPLWLVLWRNKRPLIATTMAAFLLFLWFLAISPRYESTEFVLPKHITLLTENDSTLATQYPIEELSPTDLGTLIDITDFNFLINNFPCNTSNSLRVLILVHSAPQNIIRRDIIRETWGQRDESYEVLFLLGEVKYEIMQLALEEENKVHHDLVQGSFLDTYRNLTYKHVMALKWTIYFCPCARYLLKTDDDVFVNTPSLLEFMQQYLSPFGAQNMILCGTYYPTAYVIRSNTSKWKVTTEEYADDIYPPYCAGWAVMYSSDVVFRIYKEAQREKYFWVDDVHITGTLVAKLNLTLTPLGPLVLSESEAIYLQDIKDASKVDKFVLGSYNLNPREIQYMWRVVKQKRHMKKSKPQLESNTSGMLCNN